MKKWIQVSENANGFEKISLLNIEKYLQQKPQQGLPEKEISE